MEVDSTHYYDRDVAPEVNLWRSVLYTYLDDIKKAFEAQRLMDDCERTNIRPGYFRNKEDRIVTVDWTVNQLSNGVNSKRTEFVCEMADVDYLYFKKRFYEFTEEQRKLWRR